MSEVKSPGCRKRWAPVKSCEARSRLEGEVVVVAGEKIVSVGEAAVLQVPKGDDPTGAGRDMGL
jgi:hypothetical protein